MAQAHTAKPIIWSIAGNDSGGGAGLSADARAAAAFGVHLCPVVAAITAQNSQAITQVQPVAPALLDAQLAALADDMPPAVIKTGLLGSAENVRVVLRWFERLQRSNPQLQLVVDPVLAASTGKDLADDSLLQAYVHDLLPRTNVFTPNNHEAARLALLLEAPAQRDKAAAPHWPHLADGQSVCITGGDTLNGAWALDWVQSPQATGWLALPRLAQAHSHGTGCTFATSVAAALALGFVAADAFVLAKMATSHALEHAYAAGNGAGPVQAQAGFAMQAQHMPYMSWGRDLPAVCDPQYAARMKRTPALACDVYVLVDSLARLEQALAAGAKLLQLRIKTPVAADAACHSQLAQDITAAVALAKTAGADLFINDHSEQAMQAAASGLHLGQEDWQALSIESRHALLSGAVKIGLSSHSLWELARARSIAPAYIACGPVWPTTTKDMPWLPQGLDNLSWWVHMAGCPVVGIGGVLDYEQAAQVARTGAHAVCLVRGLGGDMQSALPPWRQAFATGAAQARLPIPALPHSSLSA